MKHNLFRSSFGVRFDVKKGIIIQAGDSLQVRLSTSTNYNAGVTLKPFSFCHKRRHFKKSESHTILTHWGWSTVADILQTIQYSNAICWTKIFSFWFNFTDVWSKLTISQHWFGYWLAKGRVQAINWTKVDPVQGTRPLLEPKLTYSRLFSIGP